MDKMQMQTPDLTAGNVDKIAALFPNCITETKGEDGKLKRAINFAMLRQMLSGDVVEGDEAYEFTWVGKKAAIVEANTPIRKTLRPCPEESVNWDTTENLYIEGDNLEVLKLLRESYLGKVKMIYIDPPYNTGNDFIYRDNFAQSADEYDEESGAFDEDGNRLFKNTDSNGRFHSDWCSMIYSRLMLARDLLTEDGVIFISIDDNEQATLKAICDEVFGYNNFIGIISWFKKASPSNDAQFFSNDIEYLLVYAVDKMIWRPNRLPLNEKQLKYYQNPDNDPRGPWNSATYTCNKTKNERPNLFYPIQNPHNGKMVYPKDTAVWKYSKEQTDKYIMDNRLFWGVDGNATYPRIKKFLSEHEGVVNRTLWHYDDVNHTQGATEELKSLGITGFSTPKPSQLVKRMIQIASDDTSIILDFFSGSATTAHAVMAQNFQDVFNGKLGKRKFIMVQLPEECDEKSEAYKVGYKTICEIGKERIRRAGKKEYMDACAFAGSSQHWDEDKRGKDPNYPCPESVDTGFRVFKLDSTNMNDVYYSAGEYTQDLLSQMESNIKDDRTSLDLLFGCLLEWGLPLSLPYKSELLDGCTVHTYNDGDLIACFDENIPESVIKTIAKRQPLRAVFRDSGFEDSPAKINVGEIFKMLAPDTRVKVI